MTTPPPGKPDPFDIHDLTSCMQKLNNRILELGEFLHSSLSIDFSNNFPPELQEEFQNLHVRYDELDKARAKAMDCMSEQGWGEEHGDPYQSGQEKVPTIIDTAKPKLATSADLTTSSLSARAAPNWPQGTSQGAQGQKTAWSKRGQHYLQKPLSPLPQVEQDREVLSNSTNSSGRGAHSHRHNKASNTNKTSPTEKKIKKKLQSTAAEQTETTQAEDKQDEENDSEIFDPGMYDPNRFSDEAIGELKGGEPNRRRKIEHGVDDKDFAEAI